MMLTDHARRRAQDRFGFHENDLLGIAYSIKKKMDNIFFLRNHPDHNRTLFLAIIPPCICRVIWSNHDNTIITILPTKNDYSLLYDSWIRGTPLYEIKAAIKHKLRIIKHCHTEGKELMDLLRYKYIIEQTYQWRYY